MFHSALTFDSKRYRLRHDLSQLPEAATPTQDLAIAERRFALRQRIGLFQQTLERVTPLDHTDNTTSEASTSCPEQWPLWLPSSLPLESRSPGSLFERLGIIEQQLRFAQASDTIADICRCLCVRSHLHRYKHMQVHGQRQNTRANALLQNVEKKIAANASRYRRARDAYMALRNGADVDELKPLEDADIRPLGDALDSSHRQGGSLGEGRRTVSWIWMRQGSVESEHNEGKSYNLLPLII